VSSWLSFADKRTVRIEERGVSASFWKEPRLPLITEGPRKVLAVWRGGVSPPSRDFYPSRIRLPGQGQKTGSPSNSRNFPKSPYFSSRDRLRHFLAFFLCQFFEFFALFGLTQTLLQNMFVENKTPAEKGRSLCDGLTTNLNAVGLTLSEFYPA